MILSVCGSVKLSMCTRSSRARKVAPECAARVQAVASRRAEEALQIAFSPPAAAKRCPSNPIYASKEGGLFLYAVATPPVHACPGGENSLADPSSRLYEFVTPI